MKKLNLNLKINFFSKKAKIIFTILLVLVACGSAGYYSWDKWTKSPEYALENFNKALLANDFLKAREFVNYNSLEADILQTVLNYILETPTDKKLSEIKSNISAELEKILSANREKAENNSKPDEEFDILKTPVSVIATDILSDLKGNIPKLQTKSEDIVILSSKIQHKQLKQEFDLKLAFKRVDKKWKIVKIANISQLAKQYSEAVDMATKIARDKYLAENDNIVNTINKHYSINSCSAKIFGPDRYGTIHLHIALDGINNGESFVATSAIFVSFKGKDNKYITTLRLENTRKVLQGENFSHTWELGFENDPKEVVALLKAGEIKCSAKTIAASIGRSKLLFPDNWRDYVETNDK